MDLGWIFYIGLANFRKIACKFLSEFVSEFSREFFGLLSPGFRSGGCTVPTKRLFKENAPLIIFILMGSFARKLFSRTLLPWPILCYSGEILHAKVLEHLVWSNTSGFQFWGPLARTNFLSALCGRPIQAPPPPKSSRPKLSALLSNFTSLSQIVFHADFRLTGEINIKVSGR